jgi:hypothetical protein
VLAHLALHGKPERAERASRPRRLLEGELSQTEPHADDCFIRFATLQSCVKRYVVCLTRLQCSALKAACAHAYLLCLLHSHSAFGYNSKCANICPDDVLKEVRPSRSKEVGALQNRIRELESTLAARDGTPYSGHRTRPQSPTNGSSSIHDEASYQSYEPYNASATADNSQHPGIQDVAEVMGTLLLGDDGSSRYLGKSAANALFHEEGSDQDHASVGSVDDEDDLASTYSGRFQPGGFPMVSRGLDAEDFQAMLPPISETQRLANAYYTNCAYVSLTSASYARVCFETDCCIISRCPRTHR